MYGDYIRMHLIKFDERGKEIFNTHIFDKSDGVEMELKRKENTVDVTEIFTNMHQGDSAVVRIAQKLVDKAGKVGRFYTYKLYLLYVDRRNLYFDQKDKHRKEQQIADSLAIENYIKSAHLNGCDRDTYGNVYYRNIITTAPQISAGDTVKMHYIGKFLDNKEFDNSYERKQPFSFVVDAKQVIEGLDKAIRHFNFGDKGIIFIPSGNAYGDKENNGIPANSVLIFEVEMQE